MFFTIREKLNRIEKDIKILNHDVEYLAGKSGVHDMKIYNILKTNSIS